MTIPVEYDAAMRDQGLMAITRLKPLRYAFVSNSAEVGESIRRYIDPQIEELTIRLATMEAAVPVAKNLLADGVDIVIGGGGTGNLLAQTIGQPVVKFERDSLDLLMALRKARHLGTTVALTSFAKRIDGAEVYEELLGLKIRQVVFSSSLELSEGIEAAVREKCEVVVGGGVCRQIATSLGVQGVVVLPRETNILQTLKESRAIALARRKERRDFQELRTIIETSRDGLIVLDVEGRVKFANEAIVEILKPLISNDGMVMPATELPSVLAPTGILATLETGEAQIDRVRRVGPIDLVVSSAPIKVDGVTVGVVGTLREATQIQNIDRKVREKLYAKGFVAKYSFSHIKGSSPFIQRVLQRARRFARSEAAIMIEGETGAGKELLAQSIHNASRRSEKPFLAVNCSALSDSLLESELFGYEEGAFTGARRGGKIGLFELAQGGSLFLDEVADISPALQLRLLRVIEEKEIMRLGGDRMVAVDVRIISSSQRELGPASVDGNFRRDLYFRLGTLKLVVPPLRERVSDIPEIVKALFAKHGVRMGNIAPRICEALCQHPWLGNMRELESLVRTYIALAENEDFSEKLFLEVFDEMRTSSHASSQHSAPTASVGGALKDQVHQFEKMTVARVLKECDFNRSKAAERLGISLNSLWRKSRQSRLDH